jgi:predicted TIM-barrel fold metal-dependent hydrolase
MALRKANLVKTRADDLRLTNFQPKSMLKVPETIVERPRFTTIDFHAHLSFGPELSAPARNGGEPKILISADQVVPLMDAMGIQLLVNVTGGCGKCLEQTIEWFVKPHPARFAVFVEPWWQRVIDPGYPQFQADQIERAKKAGARGLKILKTLGLYLREHVTTGPLILIDDRRFDPMWEAAGALRMPVLVHTSDPEAFFLPIDGQNERYEELHVHPEWSFTGNFPSNKELHEARNRVIERHPTTHFVLAHVGDAENLAWVAEWLDRYPNVSVDMSARIGELGRQPRTARRFFDRYQDRIVFATDAIPFATDFPQQTFCAELYRIYSRFLETEDEYFDYAPSQIPPQGRWRIYGLGLPDTILKKVYHQNASRLLGITGETARRSP